MNGKVILYCLFLKFYCILIGEIRYRDLGVWLCGLNDEEWKIVVMVVFKLIDLGEESICWVGKFLIINWVIS